MAGASLRVSRKRPPENATTNAVFPAHDFHPRDLRGEVNAGFRAGPTIRYVRVEKCNLYPVRAARAILRWSKTGRPLGDGPPSAARPVVGCRWIQYDRGELTGGVGGTARTAAWTSLKVSIGRPGGGPVRWGQASH